MAAVTGGAAAGYAVGTAAGYATTAAAARSYYATPPCTPKVVAVGGIPYFQCGSTWFNQVYSGAGPTYMVVKPQAGY